MFSHIVGGGRSRWVHDADAGTLVSGGLPGRKDLCRHFPTVEITWHTKPWPMSGDKYTFTYFFSDGVCQWRRTFLDPIGLFWWCLKGDPPSVAGDIKMESRSSSGAEGVENGMCKTGWIVVLDQRWQVSFWEHLFKNIKSEWEFFLCSTCLY